MTAKGRPRTVMTTPAAPFTSAGCSSDSGSAPMTAWPATASAPWTTLGTWGRLAPKSARSTTSGWSRETRASNSPPPPRRAARKKASTTFRWRARSASGVGTSAPFTRRRALLASCLAAAGVRPTIGAISANGSPNMSCRTNASLSAGVSVLSTTRRASQASGRCIGYFVGTHKSQVARALSANRSRIRRHFASPAGSA